MIKTKMMFLVAAVVLSVLAPTALLAADWTPIYSGVWYQTATKTSPRRMVAYALKIDLQNPHVSMYATPSNGGAAYETVMRTVPNFRSTYGLEAAINANFFVSHSPNAEIEGLLISNGTTVSTDQAYRQAQLRITSAKVASIVGNGGNPSGIHTAVSGDAYHLVNGTALGANDVADPRTSVGLSQDGRYLIMCVVDGRQSGYSDGATILDMSHWMLDFGAWNAINLDGGGSSTICTASGGVLNSPIDGGIPGQCRSVGASLGVNSSAFSYLKAKPAVFRPANTWYLRNTLTSGPADNSFAYGTSGDIPVMGDWDGNYTITPGVVRVEGGQLVWYLRNSNSGGSANYTFTYGLEGDVPVVGDWDGNSTFTPGVIRGVTWYLRNSNSGGAADYTFNYGASGDRFVTGDWNGDGSFTPGIVRQYGTQSNWLLRDSNSGGGANYDFVYGLWTDKPITGDWDGNGTWTCGIVRGNAWYVRNSNSSGNADIDFGFGATTDIPLVWH